MKNGLNIENESLLMAYLSVYMNDSFRFCLDFLFLFSFRQKKKMFPNSFSKSMGPHKSESHYSNAKKKDKNMNNSKVEIAERSQKDHTSLKFKR